MCEAEESNFVSNSSVVKLNRKNKYSFQKGFVNTPPVCYWWDTLIAPPPSHDIGLASVAI